MLRCHVRLLLGLLAVVCATLGSPGLRCFTTQCPHDDPVCIELCDDPATTGCVMIQNRNLEGELEPSYFHCTSSPSECTSSNCTLDQLSFLTPDVEYCCCTEDLCNSWPGFTDHLEEVLSSFEPTAPGPVPEGPAVCEEYFCIPDVSCIHTYKQCQPGDNCFAAYNVDPNTGRLSLVFKNCLGEQTLSGMNCSANSVCHIDNDLRPTDPSLTCCCNGPACNQNVTFTHPTQTTNYGFYECEGLGCHHSCLIVDNQPSCLCDDGFALVDEDNITCVDINECSFPDHGCTQVCTNTPGSYKCECFPGYYMDDMGICRSDDGIICYQFNSSAGSDIGVTHCQDVAPPGQELQHQNHHCSAIYSYNGTHFEPSVLSCIVGPFPTCVDPLCKLNQFNEQDPYLFACCCYGNVCNGPETVIFPSGVPDQPVSTSTESPFSPSPAAPKSNTLLHVGTVNLLDPTASPIDEEPSMTELIIFVTITGISIPLVVLIILVIVCIKIWMDKTVVIEPPPPPEDIPDSPITTVKPDFIRILGHGRFAKVYLARLGGREVAVKVFSMSEAPARDSWHKERDIYSTPLLKHRNILQYHSHEPQIKNPGMDSYWLIFDYHPYGSLYDYLQCQCRDLTLKQFASLAESAAAGLAHLHSIFSQGGMTIKPAIAHRDLKSKNILVKHDLTCAISDFGLAIKFSPGESPVEAQGQVGTSRYMAPEVLEGAISFNQESFLRIDVYAFGLILWEMASMCQLGDVPVKEYHPPFDTMVSPNPTIDEMKKVVAEERKRPTIPHGFTINSDLDHVVDIIQESWDPDAEARLSAQTIHMRFCQFQSTTVRSFNQASKESGLFSLPTSTSQHSLGSLDYRYPITPTTSTPSYTSLATMSPVDVKPPEIPFAQSHCQEGSASDSSEDLTRNTFSKPDSVEALPSKLPHPMTLNRFEHQEGAGSKLIRKGNPASCNQVADSVAFQPTMTQINGCRRHQSLSMPTKFRPSSVEASI